MSYFYFRFYSSFGFFSLIFLSFFSRYSFGKENNLEEFFYKVTINDQVVGENVLLLQGDNGDFFFRVDDLRDWRLKIPFSKTIEFESHLGDIEKYLPLTAYEESSYRVDLKEFELFVSINTEHFNKTILFKAPERVEPESSTGVYLNYDVIHASGENSQEGLNGLFELTFFSPDRLGVIRSNFRVNELFEDSSTTRLETTWRKDLIDRRESILFGDTFTSASGLSRPFRFAGFQWRKNFSVDPTFVTFPTEVIAGIADIESTVDVYVDDVLRSTINVPRGPFELERLPVVSSEGLVRLVVQDLLGREREIVQPYLFNPQNLAKGLSDFSYSVGFDRLNFGIDNANYENLFMSFNHRYGFSDLVTVEAQLEADSDLLVVGAGAGIVLSGYGRLNPEVLLNESEDGSGYLLGIGYNYTQSVFGFGLQSEYASENFRQLGLPLNGLPSSRRDQISLSWRLHKRGSLVVNFVNRKNRTLKDKKLLTLSYRKNFSIGLLSISAVRSMQPSESYSIAMGFSFFLSKRKSASVRGNFRDDELDSSFQYSFSRGGTHLGSAHQLRLDRYAGDRYTSTNVFRNRTNRFTADVFRDNQDTRLRFGLSGSVSVVDGGVFLSQPIRDGFAIVNTGKFNNVGILRDNQKVGKTNSHGRLLVPGLGSYRANRLSINANKIPFSAEIENSKIAAVPYALSAVLVDFQITDTQHVTLVLRDKGNDFISAGAKIYNYKNEPVGRVGLNGYSYFTKHYDEESVYRVDLGGSNCNFNIDTREISDFFSDLGTVQCL